jgi:REP element-mobilizing transposase RayT
VAQSLARVLVHLVFSTKNRVPVLHPDIRQEQFPYLAVTLTNNDCPSLRVGGVADHVHLFFGLSRTKSISETVELVKVPSSRWIKTKGIEFADFHWQAGYGIFSVSQSNADEVCRYIDDQERHHQRMTYQEELREFFKRYRVEYDERYVWD